VPEFKFYPNNRVTVLTGLFGRDLVDELSDTMCAYFEDVPARVLSNYWPSTFNLQLHLNDPVMAATTLVAAMDYTAYEPDVRGVFSVAELGEAATDSERGRFAYAVVQMCDRVLHGSAAWKDAQLLHHIRERMGKCLELPRVAEAADNANLLLLFGAAKIDFQPVPLTEYQAKLCLGWFTVLNSSAISSRMRWFLVMLLTRCLEFLGLTRTEGPFTGAI
jgi:hypothetical protein